VRKAYLFLYSDSVGSRDAVKAWANKTTAVLHWRHDLPHSFYIISEESAQDLAKSFQEFNGRKGRFLIVEASDNRQGLLPPETWYLLRRKERKPRDG
jgi:hypothetical protein